MSKSQNATRVFNRIGFFLPLLLAFLVAAEAAYACPQHSGSAGYRTKKIANRSASPMATTVITYRAPRTYRRCGDNLIDTRGARYVASRGGDRYMAVRNGGHYRAKQARYVAVRDLDRYEAPRYVAVRRQPVYVDEGVRYVAVRRAQPRVRYVPVSEIADHYDDDIRYVSARRPSAVRYVAVRGDDDFYEAPRTRYVAVRSANSPCARAVALRSCLGNAETMSTRRVVVRDDDDVEYSTRTKHVAIRDEIEDDDDDYGDVEYDSDDDQVRVSEMDDHDEYVDAPAGTVSSTKYIDHDDDYLTASEVESPYMRQVAVRTYPETYSTRTVSYRPVSSYYDDDIDDQAFLDGGGATYVAAGDFDDACSRPVAYREAPAYASMRRVSYVPMDDVDDYAFHGGSAGTYIEMRQPVSNVSYVAADEHEGYVDSDATYVAADHDMDTASYVAVDDSSEHMDTEPVSYVASDEVEDMDMQAVSYLPADTTYVAADEYCPMEVSYVEEQPVYVAERRAVMVEEVGSSFVGLSPAAARIAQTLGFNEGFEDGLDDLNDGDHFEPSDTGAQGYEDEYGDKDAYRVAFRTAYLMGYNAGFKSLAPAL